MSSSQADVTSHEDKKFKRTYVACLNCRVRKVKCDLGNLAVPGDRCRRCTRERRDCVFVDSKKRKVSRTRVPPGDSNTPPHQDGSGGRDENRKDDKDPKHFSTMEGALVFLANAAGKIASADERDHIDAREKHSRLDSMPMHLNSTSNSSSGTDIRSRQPSSTSLSARNSNNASSSQPVLNSAGLRQSFSVPESDTPGSDSKQSPWGLSSIPPYINSTIPSSDRLSVPPIENSYEARPQTTRALADIEYIGESGILNAQEAEYLINQFFATMHPFFPHIPKFLRSPEALSGYPILLCAILTISSRYNALQRPGSTDVPKHIEVHDRLWLYVQRLISQTVWAEASTRSIGTVYAFLLFTEWNPRAIHWRWSDYANRADDNAATREIDATSASSEPTGLGAMRRSYRMAWMLIGSAVRLAQDTGFMELSPKTFLASHIAEINSVMNMKRRSMLSHSLAEVDLDADEISESNSEMQEELGTKTLPLSNEIENIDASESPLLFTRAQKAQIELLQIVSVGHESLYGYKAQLGSLSQRQNLSVLSFVDPMINGWRRKYRNYLVPTTSKLARKITAETLQNSDSKTRHSLNAGFENESFIFEFNYTKLYIYSLALSSSPKSRDGTNGGKVNLKLDEISKSAKYIEQAFNAANEILQVAHRVNKLKLLRFMPVRWVTRIVRAVAFIVKCYLTITAHKKSEFSADLSGNREYVDATILSFSLISVEEIAQSIQKAAITLRDCSPDELHLCTRYSNVLLYLYSEMKSTLTKSHNRSYEENDDDQAEKDHTEDESSERQESNVFAAREQFTDTLRSTSELAFTGDSEVMDWFINNRNIGLDFVGPWTELIEHQIEEQNFNFAEELNLN